MARNTAPKKAKKDNSLRNAIIAFGVTMVGYASIFPFHNLFGFLLGGAISFAVASLIKVMTTPMKGLSAPATSDKINPDSVQDEYARQIIVTGLELMSQLRAERDAINEYVFTRRLNELAQNYADLLNKVVANHDKASNLRKLNSYYIPTALKLLQSYREAKGNNTSYMEISKTRDDILKSLDQLITATNTLKKKMLKSHLENIDIKCEVLEDILKADGYIEDELTSGMRESAHQAARQIPMAQQANVPLSAAARQAAGSARQAAPAKPAQPPKSAANQPAAQTKAAPASTIPVQTAEAAGTPRPTIKVNMPTASAQQLDQGAPVLQVPGMFGFEEDSAEDAQTSRMS
ncbi:MAG: exosortase/archaeosortase family protein [Aristaeellaceae bacterium]